MALEPVLAQEPSDQDTIKATKKEKRERKQNQKADKDATDQSETDRAPANGKNNSSEADVEITSDTQSQTGDLVLAEGYVNATMDDMRLQADRVTYNQVTGDMIAEGNVVFDQGPEQRVTANRAEINWKAGRGVFWDTTGFTNRTQTGDYLYFVAARVEKTGEDTYELYEVTVTACEDATPKWSFHTRHGELKMDDRLKLRGAVFRVKGVPTFFMPYAWIPATRSERKSGFLIPTTGSSNEKGRTIKTAYYQTLGKSADITFRNDVYTKRGLGFGAEFRAQTDERSYMKLGVFTVKDRLFGVEGEDQGGTAFVADAVQYLPHGWLAVGNVSFVTNLRFRQVFSDDINQVIDPRRESVFYLNNNGRGFSFNFLAANETTTLFRPNPDTPPDQPPSGGTSFDVKIRQAPQIDMTVYPRRIRENLPVYFSLDASFGALKRQETVDEEVVFVTPAAVQRFDFEPRITIPLASLGGVAITPTITFRNTFYTSSRDPLIPRFDPNNFALSPDDVRLNPSRVEFDPDVILFDRNTLNPVIARDLSRRYVEFETDIRPPSLEKIFLREDGSRRFKHVIEPYITYRLIKGVGEEFERIIRFDDRDAVANTNEFEYAIVNRFFTSVQASEVRRGRGRNRRREPDNLDTVQPQETDNKKPDEEPEKKEPETEAEAAKQQEEKKQKLETGRQSELNRDQEQRRQRNPRSNVDLTDDDDTTITDSPVQAYEFLSVKVAQKYFFDRTFGGALIEGRRNQFYPINTLSGFTFGGISRAFSPVNLQVRYRPLSTIFADVRMDIGTEDQIVRNLTLGGGMSTDKFLVSAKYNLARRVEFEPNKFEAGTFDGNQLVTTFQFGDETRGFYGGTRIGYDFTDRFVSNQVVGGRLRNSNSYTGYQWDCCGVQFNYGTFKAGLRSESAFSFTFSLAGLGSFGTDQFAQLGGGRGGRRRGRRARRDPADNF
jgi:LPS-assembly protein